jgi:hypothetical protein
MLVCLVSVNMARFFLILIYQNTLNVLRLSKKMKFIFALADRLGTKFSAHVVVGRYVEDWTQITLVLVTDREMKMRIRLSAPHIFYMHL